MTFEQVWDGVEIGMLVTVSNGAPMPQVGTFAYRCWRTHNFAGHLVNKVTPEGGGHRLLRIEYLSEAQGVLCFDVSEHIAHDFSLD